MILNFFKTKIGAAVIVAIVIIGIGIILKASSGPKEDIASKVALIADATVKDALEKGEIATPNWEDALKMIRGTSTDDGKIATLASTTYQSETKELTATDRFARTFFTKYIELKKSGAPIDENTGTNLVNQLLSQDYGSPSEEKIYTEADIQIAPSSSISAIKSYANSLGAIINSPSPKGYEPELAIIARMSNSEDLNVDDLAKLDLNVIRYKNMRDKMVALPVPSPLKAGHLALINSMSKILEGVRGMTLIKSDPVGATKMILLYQDGLNSLPLSLEVIKTYLKKQAISFTSSENGYILVN
jgi:hypothetical protein